MVGILLGTQSRGDEVRQLQRVSLDARIWSLVLVECCYMLQVSRGSRYRLGMSRMDWCLYLSCHQSIVMHAILSCLPSGAALSL